MSLLFESKALKYNAPEFIPAVIATCSRLGIEPNWLMLIMDNESGFRPAIVNPTGGATGLIQFMPDTAKDLGTTTAKLKEMTGVQQLYYVEKYYSKLIRQLGAARSALDLYVMTFYPYALKKSDTYVIGSEVGRAAIIAKQNPGFDVRKVGQITKSDMRAYLLKRYKDSAAIAAIYGTDKKKVSLPGSQAL